jgi:hypothetical protein
MSSYLLTGSALHAQGRAPELEERTRVGWARSSSPPKNASISRVSIGRRAPPSVSTWIVPTLLDRGCRCSAELDAAIDGPIARHAYAAIEVRCRSLLHRQYAARSTTKRRSQQGRCHKRCSRVLSNELCGFGRALQLTSMPCPDISRCHEHSGHGYPWRHEPPESSAKAITFTCTTSVATNGARRGRLRNGTSCSHRESARPLGQAA